MGYFCHTKSGFENHYNQEVHISKHFSTQPTFQPTQLNFFMIISNVDFARKPRLAIKMKLRQLKFPINAFLIIVFSNMDSIKKLPDMPF